MIFFKKLIEICRIGRLKNAIVVIFFAGMGAVLLSGCANINSSLEREHIMNNGCFITCGNNKINNNVNIAYNGYIQNRSNHIGYK